MQNSQNYPVYPVRNSTHQRKDISNGVKLILGFIYKKEAAFKKTKKILTARLGEADFPSPALDFKHTDYYEREFGRGLKRRFFSFKKLIRPQQLAKIKASTNEIEEELSRKGKRSINIDPGYLTLSKLVLATTKDYTHRIYLKDGIYAEVTLFYQQGTFRAWPWTYPDYKTAEYIAIFNQIREIYAQQIKN